MARAWINHNSFQQFSQIYNNIVLAEQFSLRNYWECTRPPSSKTQCKTVFATIIYTFSETRLLCVRKMNDSVKILEYRPIIYFILKSHYISHKVNVSVKRVFCHNEKHDHHSGDRGTKLACLIPTQRLGLFLSKFQNSPLSEVFF